MRNQTISTLFTLFTLFLIFLQTCRIVESSKRRIHIEDDLDDVVDEEEDDAWKEWGKKKQPDFDPPPSDFTQTSLLHELQEEMMKRQLGPAFGFVKLVPGIRRNPEMVSDIAMKWTKVARTGAIEVKFTGVDVSTIMFTMQQGQDTLELKEFILSQSDAYEIKIGDHLFRRPGDSPFEQVFEKLQADKDERHHEL